LVWWLAPLFRLLFMLQDLLKYVGYVVLREEDGLLLIGVFLVSIVDSLVLSYLLHYAFEIDKAYVADVNVELWPQ
jgi:hypothetical protein